MTAIDLSGKIAIITGAGRGIGRAEAVALARAGARVVVNDLGCSLAGEGSDSGPATAVAQEIVASGGEAIADFEDVSSFDGAGRLVERAITSFGRLDILVNNAGILRDRMLINMAEEEWDAVLAVHAKGTFSTTRHAAAYWREQSKAGDEGPRRVISTSSPSGVFGNVGQANYGAAKAAIAALTQIAAQELGRYGVTVNCLAPNARTRMTEGIFADTSGTADAGDPLDPQSITPIVVALCADDAQDITGQCFFVFGGTVNVLQPWQSGELLAADGWWDPEELLQAVRERFPQGAAPGAMLDRLAEVGVDLQSPV